MCGIFSVLNSSLKSNYYQQFNAGNKRGPENSKYLYVNNSLIMGFHRLAINGLNDISDQPMKKHNCILICNGEIYNYKKLYELIDIKPKTQSDCEVILDLYHFYGIEHTLEMLDGVFAFILYDSVNNCIYAARDTYGVRPLFIGTDTTHNSIGLASEIKMLHTHFDTIKQYAPGSYSKYDVSNNNWKQQHVIRFFKGFSINNTKQSIEDYSTMIRDSLISEVEKRVENTERDIVVTLSGGLDSSIIAAVVCEYIKKHYPERTVETFSIGMKGSQDLEFANIVASYLDTQHTSIVLTEDDFFNAIPKVIKSIESYDTTSVRASVGNYLVAEYIRENTESKVVFNGDGADEITGGYLYFHKAPDSVEFDKECKRLLNDICFFDVLRSDRSIASNGLEARTPFLGKNFVSTYMSIPYDIRNHNIGEHQEKYLLREAFKGYLPESVLYRKKEAFSDGVSKETRSWHKIIEEKLETKDVDMSKIYSHNQPKTKEQFYYRALFEEYYCEHGNVIPYFWMPSWSDGVTDASARELDVY
jgi:asparagine synthase (glutamine-hydrolysing)